MGTAAAHANRFPAFNTAPQVVPIPLNKTVLKRTAYNAFARESFSGAYPGQDRHQPWCGQHQHQTGQQQKVPGQHRDRREHSLRRFRPFLLSNLNIGRDQSGIQRSAQQSNGELGHDQRNEKRVQLVAPPELIGHDRILGEGRHLGEQRATPDREQSR